MQSRPNYFQHLAFASGAVPRQGSTVCLFDSSWPVVECPPSWHRRLELLARELPQGQVGPARLQEEAQGSGTLVERGQPRSPVEVEPEAGRADVAAVGDADAGDAEGAVGVAGVAGAVDAAAGGQGEGARLVVRAPGAFAVSE